jgi:hypothetical protein
MLQTSHLQELKQRYASMYIQQEDTEEVEVSEGIRDFKLGDAVKFVNDDSDFLGQTGKITSLSGNGISQKATVKLDKGGKSVTNVLVKVDLIKEEVAEGWKKGKYTIKDENGKILGTYSSGGKAKKVMDDLMQKGDYPELTVSMVEEVEVDESNELQAIMALDDVGIEASINKKDQVVVKKKDLKKAEAALKKSFRKGGAPELHAEEVEIEEKFNKKKFDDNEDKNDHTGNGVELVNMFGTTSEKKTMAQIQKNHDKNGEISRKDQSTRDAMVKKYYPKLEEVEIEEKIEKESYGSFITAAAKAKKEGKKTFMMGGKKYPVTIKQKISAAYEEAEVEEAKLYAAKGTAYPATIDTLKMIVREKQNQTVMFKSGKAIVDLFTASAMVQVYDALKKPEMKKTFEKMIGDKAGFLKTQAFAMKMISGGK